MNKVMDLDEVMERVHDGEIIMFASKMCNLIKFMAYNIDTIRVTPRGLNLLRAMHEIKSGEYNYSGDIYKYKFYNILTNGGDFYMNLKNNFSKITKSLSESASNVVQKSNELIGVSALNGEINNEEKKKDIIYIAIGKIVYNSFINKAELSEEIKHKCEAVLEHDEEIKIIMEKIINVKRIKKCPNCGSDMNISINFCPDCGVMHKLIEDDNTL